MIKRFGLFILVNFAIMFTVMLIVNVLGIRPYLDHSGIHYGSLMAFCLVYGMAGSFISLLMSKQMAKWMMGLQIVDPGAAYGQERFLLDTVARLAQTAGLPKCPEVAVYQSPEVNAFATGPSKRNALVAVSSGLLSSMSTAEVEGVLSHEISHIANGDMVTMTLLQGPANTFVYFLARVVAMLIDQFFRSRNDNSSGRGGGLGFFGYYMVVSLMEMVFFVFASLVISWFSRQREFRADKGSANIGGREKMIRALSKLKVNQDLRMGMGNVIKTGQSDPKAAFQSLMVSGRKKLGFLQYFSTHPPIEDRIARLNTIGA